jgi:hypothetical protein
MTETLPGNTTGIYHSGGFGASRGECAASVVGDQHISDSLAQFHQSL